MRPWDAHATCQRWGCPRSSMACRLHAAGALRWGLPQGRGEAMAGLDVSWWPLALSSGAGGGGVGWFLCVLHLQVAPSFRAGRSFLPHLPSWGWRRVGMCPALSWASKTRAGLCALTTVSPGCGHAPQQGAGAGMRQVLRLLCAL